MRPATVKSTFGTYSVSPLQDSCVACLGQSHQANASRVMLFLRATCLVSYVCHRRLCLPWWDVWHEIGKFRLRSLEPCALPKQIGGVVCLHHHDCDIGIGIIIIIIIIITNKNKRKQTKRVAAFSSVVCFVRRLLFVLVLSQVVIATPQHWCFGRTNCLTA